VRTQRALAAGAGFDAAMAVDAAPRDETTCGRFAAESQPSADNIWHEVSTRTSRRRGGPQGGGNSQSYSGSANRSGATRAPSSASSAPPAWTKPRELGYKAKQGVVVARVSVRKGGSRKQRHKAGRRSKRQGVNRLSRRKSIQRISEERASRKYRNLRVLNSYWVGEDGSQKWHEVILVDPNHPAIENDGDLGWIASDDHKGRAFRGLTSAGTKGRGQRTRGTGTEKTRPSVTGNDRQGK